MKETIGFGDFCDAFKNHDRTDNFSYSGLKVLYEWLDEIEPEYTLDVIALCCEFNEEPRAEVAENHRLAPDVDVLDFLNENTMVVGESDAGIVYAAF